MKKGKEAEIDYQAIVNAKENIPGMAVVCGGCRFAGRRSISKLPECKISIDLDFLGWFKSVYYKEAATITEKLKEAPNGCVLKR